MSFCYQLCADSSWEQSHNCGSCLQNMEKDRNTSVNCQAEFSFSSDRGGSVKVSDAVEMCKAELLKHVVESPPQTTSFQQTENTHL